jgi:6-phosphofructokinase
MKKLRAAHRHRRSQSAATERRYRAPLQGTAFARPGSIPPNWEDAGFAGFLQTIGIPRRCRDRSIRRQETIRSLGRLTITPLHRMPSSSVTTDDLNIATDASGNELHADIGSFLKDRINRHFKEKAIELNLKYIDPSYIIRSVPAAPEDRVFCLNLGRHAVHAVHAGMAGKTGMVVARWHQRFVHLPMSLVTCGRRKVDSNGDLWRLVVELTGQPAKMGV